VGDTVYDMERRQAGLRLHSDGVQPVRVSPQAIERPPRSLRAMEETLRKNGVPVDELKKIASTMDFRRFGDPEEAARIDAEVMEDLAPLRANANRAELPDWP